MHPAHQPHVAQHVVPAREAADLLGIDPDMRGKCMELITVFDLDFMLTSEIE